MTALASPVVAFENQFSTRLASLTIEKQVDKEYEKDRVPDHVFTFKVVIGDGSDTTTQYPYMLGEISGHIISGGIIQLKNGQVAVIENIPVGTNYTVTEVLEGVSDDYKTAVNGKEGFTTNGVLSADGERAVFLNTYLKHFADLTITKSGAEAIDENQSFLFTLSGEGITLDVIVRGNGSVTIKDLPIGTYTVTENTDWSWRYTPENNVKQKTITLTADGNNGVKFSNYRSVIHWLSGDSFRENQFNKTQSVRTGGKEAV